MFRETFEGTDGKRVEKFVNFGSKISHLEGHRQIFLSRISPKFPFKYFFIFFMNFYQQRVKICEKREIPYSVSNELSETAESCMEN